MRSVFGNFMKEVFFRIAITIFLFGVYFEIMSVETFILSIVVVYALRMFIMFVYALKVYTPKFSFGFPNSYKKILQYSSLIVIAGSISIILLDIDKVMIGKYLALENVAFYNVAIFIATVIVVPTRSMSQITAPITARLINEKQWTELEFLYKKTSLTLLIISGWIFLLIISNINQLYLLIDPVYSAGLFVVLLISLVKLFENMLGNNAAIITNSEYYIWLVILGVFLAVLTIGLNIWLIPKYGINGVAIATFCSLFLYNVLKIILVYKKHRIQPFGIASLKVLLLIGVLATSYWFDFGFHPMLNILLKTIILTLTYFTVIHVTRLSEDISGLFNKRV
jgi:O-antigen/teichoic acid export membrane protein